jgi:hydroxymethylpyrimidine pyrophosphatase-like HAD family hydrolase
LIGVAFDIDDTVTRAGRLELAAFQAMHELAGSGLHLVAVTGRPLGWVDVVAVHWPVDAAVGENGAGWVWRDGERPREDYFEPEEKRRAYPDLFERVRRRVARELPHVRPAVDQRARRCDLAYDVGETVKLPPEDVEALVGLIEAEGARSAVSSVHAHAIPGDWDKARGIERAARDALGLDTDKQRERWLFVGDSANDAAAFEYFPLSVGVSNVRDYVTRLPTVPRFITGADRGKGFAEMAAHLLEARR